VQFGNLSLSIVHGALGADELSIADDPSFGGAPFLRAKAIRVGVELMPLVMSRSLNITNITIDGAEVTLLRNAAGQWNVSTFATAGAASQQSSASSGAGLALAVGKIALKNSRVIIGSTESPKRSTYDHVTLTATNVSLTSAFPLAFSADLPSGGTMKIEGTVGPLDAHDAVRTALDATLKVTALNLASTGVLDPSLGLGGLLDLDATLASHDGKARVKGTATLTKAQLVAGGSPATVPLIVALDALYDLGAHSGQLDPSSLKIGSATAHLSGTFESPKDTTNVNMKIQADAMPARDLEAFLPAVGISMPKGAALTAGALSMALTLSGPTDKLVTSGNINLSSATVAGFDLVSKLSAISALAGVKSGKDLLIEKLASNVHIAPDGVAMEQITAVVPALGSVVGAGAIDAKNHLDFKVAATFSGAAGAAAGSMTSAIMGRLGGGTGCGGATTVPFIVEGTTTEPKFSPDVGGLAAGMLKSQLSCLGGKPASGSAQQPASSNPLGALSGLLGKKK